MLIRFDVDPDDVLDVKVLHHDEDGEAISPPLLVIRDKATGERYILDREQAWKLRDLIEKM